MTRAPEPAWGLLDPGTDDLLGLTATSVTWVRAGGARVDVTPEHEWRCAAVGGGALALAGEGWLTWRGDGEPLRVECGPAYRVAVRGATVAVVSDDGEVTVWPQVSDSTEPARGRVAFAPDGLALDGERGRLAVFGSSQTDEARLALFDIGDSSLAPITPQPAWPDCPHGVAFPLAGGAIGLGTDRGVVVAGIDGGVTASLDLQGLERLAGSGDLLVWVRSGAAVGPSVGVGHVAGSTVTVSSEHPLPGDDPFPELGVTSEGVVVIAGEGPSRLATYRTSPEGWAGPTYVDLLGPQGTT